MTPVLLETIASARRLTRLYNESDPSDAAGRRSLLERLLGSVGANVEIDTPFRCDFGKNVHVADRVIVGMNCTFVDNARIDIGPFAMIASDVQICTATHDVDAAARLTPKGGSWYTTLVAPVRIGARVWVGATVVLLTDRRVSE